MCEITQEQDRTITSMCLPSIKLFQMYWEQLVNGGRSHPWRAYWRHRRDRPDDDLQFTPEGEALRIAYNDEMDISLDDRQFWVLLQGVLKRGENHIEAYLDREKIEYMSKNIARESEAAP